MNFTSIEKNLLVRSASLHCVVEHALAIGRGHFPIG